MTTLTKKDRAAFVEKALTDLWAPLRVELRELADAEALADAKAKHPRFFELYADPANREYLQYTTSKYLSDFGLIKSGATADIELDGDGFALRYRSGADYWYSCNITLPDAWSRDGFAFSDALVEKYKAYTARYMDALETLTSTINAYKSREKFEVDFPELVKYLPPRTVAATSTAVAVPVEDIKAKFLKMGIPPKE